MSRPPIPTAITFLLALFTLAAAPADDPQLRLTLRGREAVKGLENVYDVTERPANWEAKKTALIVIDVWDKHWCDGANKRVAEMAPRFSSFVDTLRSRGVFVIHAPSDTMKTYDGTPGR